MSAYRRRRAKPMKIPSGTNPARLPKCVRCPDENPDQRTGLCPRCEQRLKSLAARSARVNCGDTAVGIRRATYHGPA